MAKKKKKKEVEAPAYHRKGETKKAIVGKPLKPDFQRNCLACFNYAMCRDPEKSRAHLCSKFSDIDFEIPEGGEDALVLESKPDKKKRDEKFIWTPPEDDSEESLEKFMLSALSKNVTISDDAFVFNDDDLPRANNFLQFTASKKFLGLSPFPKQVEWGIGFHQEYCPRCSDIDWVTNIPKRTSLNDIKEHATLLRQGICPDCGATKAELIKKGELTDYYEFAGLVGQRAGKTAWLGMDSAYVTHQFLKTPSPAKLFGVTDNMILYATFAAVTFDQAMRNVWNPYVKPYVTVTPWFSEYLKMLDYYADKNSRPLYKAMDTFMAFAHKGLVMAPLTPDKRTLRGATRYLASIDELGWFDTHTNMDKNRNSVRANSEETLTALNNSLMTLKNAHRTLRAKGNSIVPPPVMINISSPSSADDGICRRIKAAKVDPQIYAVQAPTWKISPKYGRNDPEIKAAFAVDKVAAARDWGADPPFSRNAFMTNYKIFKSLIADDKKARTNLIKLEREVITTDSGKQMTGATVKIKRRSITNRIMALDAGSKFNSFAMAIGRIDPDTNFIMLEGLGEIVPIYGKEISFNAIYEDVIGPIIDETGVTMLVADRWQSKKLLQDAEADYEIESREYSLKMSDFIQYRDTIFEGRIMIPKPEMPFEEIMKDELGRYPDRFESKPVSHYIHQNFTVVETLKTIEKGLNRTDDCFRAVALMVSFLNDVEVRSEFMGYVEEEEERKNRNGLGLVTSSATGQGIAQVSGIGISTGMSGAGGFTTGSSTFATRK